jgi:hypothetical protein
VHGTACIGLVGFVLTYGHFSTFEFVIVPNFVLKIEMFLVPLFQFFYAEVQDFPAQFLRVIRAKFKPD